MFFKSIWTLCDTVSGQYLKRSIETSSVIGYWSLHGKISWSLTYAGTIWRHHGELHRCVLVIGQKSTSTRELSARTREGFMAWMALHRCLAWPSPSDRCTFHWAVFFFKVAAMQLSCRGPIGPQHIFDYTDVIRAWNWRTLSEIAVISC